MSGQRVLYSGAPECHVIISRYTQGHRGWGNLIRQGGGLHPGDVLAWGADFTLPGTGHSQVPTLDAPPPPMSCIQDNRIPTPFTTGAHVPHLPQNVMLEDSDGGPSKGQHCKVGLHPCTPWSNRWYRAYSKWGRHLVRWLSDPSLPQQGVGAVDHRGRKLPVQPVKGNSSHAEHGSIALLSSHQGSHFSPSNIYHLLENYANEMFPVKSMYTFASVSYLWGVGGNQRSSQKALS